MNDLFCTSSKFNAKLKGRPCFEDKVHFIDTKGGVEIPDSRNGGFSHTDGLNFAGLD